MELGKLLILLGVTLVVVGAVVVLLGRMHVPLGRLPGGLFVSREEYYGLFSTG